MLCLSKLKSFILIFVGIDEPYKQVIFDKTFCYELLGILVTDLNIPSNSFNLIYPDDLVAFFKNFIDLFSLLIKRIWYK